MRQQQVDLQPLARAAICVPIPLLGADRIVDTDSRSVGRLHTIRALVVRRGELEVAYFVILKAEGVRPLTF